MKAYAIISATLLGCSLGYSQVDKPKELPKGVPAMESYYRAGEFNVDLYGTGNLKNEQRDSKDLKFGVGGRVTYFLTRNLGVGLSGESENAGHSVFDLVQGRVTIRAPLNNSFAPYGFVQGGFLFERDRWEAGAGGGLEFRMTRYLGTFAEAGLNVDTEGVGRMIGAVGVRISF